MSWNVGRWIQCYLDQREFSICECALRGCECSLVMIFFLDLNLVISGKVVHEGKDFMPGACINDLIDEECWEVVFRTGPIQIKEVYTNADGTYFLFMGTRFETQVV